MELESTCVVEHQSMATRNLSNSAFIWAQMTWKQKAMLVPGQGACACYSSTCCLPPLEILIPVGVGIGALGLTISGIGCCCLIGCIYACVKCTQPEPRARRDPLNAQEEPQIEDLENPELEEIAIEQAEQEQTVVLAVIQPDEPMQLKVVSADKDTANSADQTNTSTSEQVTQTDQDAPLTEQNPFQRSLDGSATWVESPKEQGSSLKNVY